MVVAITVRVNGVPGLERALARAPLLTIRNLSRAFEQDYQEWFGGMALRFRGPPGLTRRTGDLLRSLGHRIDPVRGRMVIFSAGNVYARVREFGAIVRPKTGRYLTIPMRDNLTAAGVPRFPSARALMGTGRTFVLTTKAGKKLIVERAENGSLRFLWALVERAVQPGPHSTGSDSKFGFFYTWANGSQRRIARHSRAIADALQEATRS